MAYYAVALGRKPGIYDNWEDCKEQTSGFSNTKFKKLSSYEDALEYIKEHNRNFYDENLLLEHQNMSKSQTNSEKDTDKSTQNINIASNINIAGTGTTSNKNSDHEIFYNELPDSLSNNLPKSIKEELSINRMDKELQKEKCFALLEEFFASQQPQSDPQKIEYIKKDDFVYREDYYNLPDNEALVYVDGSYSDVHSNFTYGGVIINNEGNVTSILGKGNQDDHELKQMRNVAGELKATLEAIKLCINMGYKKVYLHYDYSGIKHWVDGSWKAKKTKTHEYASIMHEYLEQIDIEFLKVRGHVGVKYNEVADSLATMAYDFHDDKLHP